MSDRILSAQEAAQYAVNAGFTGSALLNLIAIGFAESGLHTQAPDNINSDGSRDRGLYQINSRAHSEVSDACAYDPQCASNAAWQISQHGKNFGAWVAFNTGAYRQYLPNIIRELRGVTFKGQNPNDLSGQIGQNSPAPGSGANDLLNGALTALIQPILNNLAPWGIRIGFFLGALLLVIVGFWILGSGEPADAGKVTPALNKAAKL